MKGLLWWTFAAILAVTGAWWVHPGSKLAALWLLAALWWAFLGGVTAMGWFARVKVKNMVRQRKAQE